MLNLKYKPIPLLRLNGSYEYIRRGDFDIIDSLRYQDDQTFLYGDISFYSVLKFSAEYEILNNLFLSAHYIISNSWGDNNLLNVDAYKFTEISCSARYGF